MNAMAQIDGRAVAVAPGDTILSAAQRLGIAIPVLCHDPLLPPEALCRVCVVEVAGMHGLVSACSTPLAPGMVVLTETATVRGARAAILASVLEGFGRVGDDDPAIESYRRIAAWAGAAGVDVAAIAARGAPPRHLTGHDAALAISPERCIQCGLCFRYCEHLHGFHPSAIIARGGERMLSFAAGIPLEAGECDHCGNCIDHCPTGALVERWRVTHGAPQRTADSVCAYCGTGCEVRLEIRDDRISGARPHPAPDTVNRGELCVKGRFGLTFASHPDRLTTPLLRVREGRTRDCFREAGWDEALTFVARELAAIRAESGADALAVLSSARATNEENYLAQKFARAALGTNNVDNCARVCHAPSVVGLTAAFGSGAATNSLDEIVGADCLLIVGGNPIEAHPVIGHRIKEAVRRHGARLIVADPRRTALARLADVHLALTPGTNIALFHGLLRALLDENLVNREFIAARTEGFELLEALVRNEYPLERASAITGVAQDALRAAARLYAGAANGMIIYGLGVTEHIHGSANVMALANLALATGHVGRPHTGVNPLRGQNNVQGACDVGALPNVLPGYQSIEDAAVRDKFARRWGVALPTQPGLKSCQMLHAAANARLRALYVIAEDPAQTEPDTHHIERALDNLDLLVVQELFFTRTAGFAHVILPGACAHEKEGTFTNTDRRVQHFRAAVPPPGQCRPDGDILTDLAARLGYVMPAAAPAAVWDEIADLAPMLHGIRYERLVRGERLVWPCESAESTGTRTLHQGRFTRGRGRFHAMPYEPPAEAVSAGFPLLLTTGRRLAHYCNGSMSRRAEALAALEPGEHLEINPADAAPLRLRDGDAVEVASARGALTVPCRITDRSPPGTVFLSFHFTDTPTNVLTGSHFDPLAITPEYKVTAVRLRRAG
jgi:formate dehydrogenase alpha subunit